MFKKRTRPAGVRDRDRDRDRDRAGSSTPLDSGAASSSSTPGPDSHAQPLAGPSTAAAGAGVGVDSSRPPAGTSGGGAREEDVDVGVDASASTDPDISNIDELILLRKLRKAKQGIDLQRLNRGEDKHKHHRGGSGAGETSGLQTQQKSKSASKEDRGDPTDEFVDEAERLKNLVRSNNFTQQTNALDVDRHMLAYIESELAKRRGNTASEGYTPAEAYDPQAELFKLAEKYRWDNRKKDEEEGNVTNSLGMLTSIPEVDLGMDNRLRNIEATEKAKRDMMEARKAELAARRRPEDVDYSAARFHRPHLRIASDIYAMDDTQRVAAGLPPPSRPRNLGHEQATDEAVYDRFKKRMKR